MHLSVPSCGGPPKNIEVSGVITCSAAKAGEAPLRGRWSVAVTNGSRSKVVVSPPKGLGFEAEFEVILGNDGYHLDFALALSVNVDGGEFGSNTKFTIAPDHPKTIKLESGGDEAREVTCVITCERKLVFPPPFGTEAERVELAEKIAPLLP